MKVIIDGVEYVPLQEVNYDNRLMAALEVRFDSDAGDNITIREYFHRLLGTLWEEGEGFSGKRPFGNSGWDYDLYEPLIKRGFVRGKLDENGHLEEVDTKQADAFMVSLINAAFYGVEHDN